MTLKGLSYAPTGAIAAAATTSLPETPGGARNYDYRYSWIRDSTFALWGLYTLELRLGSTDFYHFITDVAERDGDLQIVYGIDGRRDLTRSELPHLQGYQGARPVRIGNGAYRQRQNDVWGAVLDSVYLHTRSRDRLDDRVWPMLRRQVENAIRHWREPDQRDLGGARRAEALHLLEGHVLGRGRPRQPAGPAARGVGPGPAAGRRQPRRSAPTC